MQMQMQMQMGYNISIIHISKQNCNVIYLIWLNIIKFSNYDYYYFVLGYII